MLRSGIPGLYGYSLLKFLSNRHIVFHSGCTILYSQCVTNIFLQWFGIMLSRPTAFFEFCVVGEIVKVCFPFSLFEYKGKIVRWQEQTGFANNSASFKQNFLPLHLHFSFWPVCAHSSRSYSYSTEIPTFWLTYSLFLHNVYVYRWEQTALCVKTLCNHYIW